MSVIEVPAREVVRPLPAGPQPDPVADIARVVRHEPLGAGNHRLVLHSARIAATALPGQFVMVTIPGFVLPRPMAIHRRRPHDGTIELIYKVAGAGTESLALSAATSLELVGPLGRPFQLSSAQKNVLLLGRGIGVCAFMTVAEDIAARGGQATAVLSARSSAGLIGIDDAVELGVTAFTVTDEAASSDTASVGRTVIDHFGADGPDGIMVCGSQRLARLAVELGRRWSAPVQVSLEAHMACGLGYCHGCALPCDGDSEGLLVCADGPVFALERDGRSQ
ncbi:dihydroorotate oxidase electron transfer subunit [Microbacterium protaetiae]|uniref:Dihydroorotate oxidase electron transfer subunit n=1 Tax=Microbacterium protaetiae TaxID=2509458 RepID=A0A4P6EBB6_9MICO|nr:dihydroorotate oxidase electron transfer subunit [Microbacterium protaetiae]QAY58563.1 dihydroorotate oxidase electron transfer subunit [Microbacterium protaetiae]